MENLEKIQKMEIELLNLTINWRNGTHKMYERIMDANWVSITIPNWRLAKKAGAKKDGYYGWILWSGSTNDNGTQFANEARKIMQKYKLELNFYERQL
tara:strand:- start:14236 stop:14529 length:294 start_codon:yes stop_codon:yes gene_type:complete